MDLAVGVIIGGAFGKIVDSVVGDLIMPVVGKIFGGLDFSNMLIVLGDNPNKLTALADLKKAGIATFAYGNFITVLINFIILAPDHLPDGQGYEQTEEGRTRRARSSSADTRRCAAAA